MSEDEECGLFQNGLFEEEPGYFKEERKACVETITIGNLKMKIRVVGEHVLWGNYVWNASVEVSKKFFNNPKMIKDKRILELGAGGGLPSIISTLLGASFVCVTDYPDDILIDNINFNVKRNIKNDKMKENIIVLPYLWNNKTNDLLKKCGMIVENKNDMKNVKPKRKKFDVIILSDLIFNHAQHIDIIESCLLCGIPNKTKIYVTFSHHIPIMSHLNMQFFEYLKEFGMDCKLIDEKKYEVMFKDDPGDLEMRKTVYSYLVTFKEDCLKKIGKVKLKKNQKKK